MKSSKESQVENTVKLLVALLAEPKTTAAALAKALGLSEAWVNVSTMRLRSAGLDIEYDRNKGRYSVGIGDELAKKFEPFVKKLRRAIAETKLSQPPIRFVSSLERYSVKEFAQYLGTSASNIGNMINGYKGQKLPTGWCAYQLSDNGKWFIQKMPTDRKGVKFTLPDNALSAKSVVVGEGAPIENTKKHLVEKSTCRVHECKDQVMSRGFCDDHYYKARRHPEQYPKPNDGLPWPPNAKKQKRKAA